MKVIRVVCFDVDGVLVDSLGAHLQICEDLGRKYGLNLRIPGPAEFKEMIRHGAKASPMNLMFETVGFPREYANRAFAEYKTTFARDYQMPCYPGIDRLLSTLSNAGLRLGIITANVRANIAHALGLNMGFFDPKCIYTMESPAAASKTESLRAATQTFAIGPGECLFVGDQLADWRAAREVGARFLGVTYGWAISKEDQEFPTVDEVSGIGDFIMQTNAIVVAHQ